MMRTSATLLNKQKAAVIAVKQVSFAKQQVNKQAVFMVQQQQKRSVQTMGGDLVDILHDDLTPTQQEVRCIPFVIYNKNIYRKKIAPWIYSKVCKGVY